MPHIARLRASLLYAGILVAAAAHGATIHRIGFLRAAAPPDSYIQAFRQGLADMGYVEGNNIVLDMQWADGQIGRLPALAADLVRRNADVIVIDGMPAVLAAKGATTRIPIIMAGIGDPLSTGVVTSMTRPGGNVTGMTIMASELGRKRLELLREVLPQVTRFAVITNPDNAAHAALGGEVVQAARAMNVGIEVLTARKGEDLEAAFTTMVRQGVGAFTVLPDQVLSAQRERIVRLAALNRLPGLYERKESVLEGGLMSYGVSYQEMYRRAAGFVAKVLKGSRAGDLPIEEPTRFELVVNMRTAKALGITMPPSLLLRADQVID